MMKLTILGTGWHSQNNHLSSLAQYASEHPGEIDLAAICDLRVDHAKEMAKKYGFARVYENINEMLEKEKPDGCIAVTPCPATAEIGRIIIEAGVPMVMEKPPGVTVEEAREIVELVERKSARVMVSMNRRFDPAIRAGLKFKGDRPIEYIRASIMRVKRTEKAFMFSTALHTLDAMREIAGDIKTFDVESCKVDGVWWYVIRFVFESGTLGVLEVLPTTGANAERYEIFGAGYRVIMQVAEVDEGHVRCWEGGELVIDEESAAGEPVFVRNGAYGETVEFITALKEGRMPHPTPAVVLQSTELGHEIADAVGM